MSSNNLEEFIQSKEELKEFFAFFGSFKMVEKLHSLNILSSNKFEELSNLQGLTNIHLASVLVEELSDDVKDNKKYKLLLDYLKLENTHVYYEILRQSKS